MEEDIKKLEQALLGELYGHNAVIVNKQSLQNLIKEYKKLQELNKRNSRLANKNLKNEIIFREKNEPEDIYLLQSKIEEVEEENKELKFCYEFQCKNVQNLQDKILELENDYKNLQDSYAARNKLLKNSIPKSRIIEQLDKLDLDYEEQERWDELYGSEAVTSFCKKLLKGE